MPRRATSPFKTQTNAQTGSSAKTSELSGAEAPRRGRKAKSTISEPTEPSLTDIFFPGSDEPVATGAGRVSGQPAKARRRRKPKAQPDAEAPASMADDSGVTAERAPPELPPNSYGESSDVQIGPSALPTASPRKARRRRTTQDDGQPEAGMDIAAASPSTQQAAARWDADTETATFDWSSIEQVAAEGGPNQAMAKLLLAARAEGASSRWPF